MRILIALLLAIMLAGCSAEGQKVAQEKAALPTDTTLPFGLNQDCECVEKNNCTVYELRAGYLEASSTTCKWTAKVNEAECEYELRFVAEVVGHSGKSEFAPENWDKSKMIARHLGNDRWCKAN